MANGMKWSLAGLLGLDISVPQLKPHLMDSMRVLGRKGKKCDVLAVICEVGDHRYNPL